MDVSDLMWYWEKHAGVGNAAGEFTVRLPMHDAARALALADMYSAETEAPIIAELLGAARNELPEAFPCTRRAGVIARDEYDDPVYAMQAWARRRS
jgi:hypothetical protein